METTDQQEKSKADIAVEYLRENGGRATMQELRAAMGLDEQYPSQFIRTQLKHGQIVKTLEGYALAEFEEDESDKPFQVGLWNDGELVISKGGQSLTLTAEDLDHLIEFQIRVGLVLCRTKFSTLVAK